MRTRSTSPVLKINEPGNGKTTSNSTNSATSNSTATTATTATTTTTTTTTNTGSTITSGSLVLRDSTSSPKNTHKSPKSLLKSPKSKSPFGTGLRHSCDKKLQKLPNFLSPTKARTIFVQEQAARMVLGIESDAVKSDKGGIYSIYSNNIRKEGEEKEKEKDGERKDKSNYGLKRGGGFYVSASPHSHVSGTVFAEALSETLSSVGNPASVITLSTGTNAIAMTYSNTNSNSNTNTNSTSTSTSITFSKSSKSSTSSIHSPTARAFKGISSDNDDVDDIFTSGDTCVANSSSRSRSLLLKSPSSSYPAPSTSASTSASNINSNSTSPSKCQKGQENEKDISVRMNKHVKKASISRLRRSTASSAANAHCHSPSHVNRPSDREPNKSPVGKGRIGGRRARLTNRGKVSSGPGSGPGARNDTTDNNSNDNNSNRMDRNRTMRGQDDHDLRESVMAQILVRQAEGYTHQVDGLHGISLLKQGRDMDCVLILS